MYSFLFRYKNLILDILIFLAIVLVIFDVAGRMQNFFLGMASTLVLIRIVDGLGVVRNRKQEINPN